MAIRKRSQARALALQALCLYDAIGGSFDAQLSAFLKDTEAHRDLGIEGELDPDLLPFARQLAQGAWQARRKLDARLSAVARDWSLKRMNPVDRNALRLGLYELLNSDDTPPEVILSEAVELARRFSDHDSSAFVNGVLDAARKLPDDIETKTTSE